MLGEEFTADATGIAQQHRYPLGEGVCASSISRASKMTGIQIRDEMMSPISDKESTTVLEVPARDVFLARRNILTKKSQNVS